MLSKINSTEEESLESTDNSKYKAPTTEIRWFGTKNEPAEKKPIKSDNLDAALGKIGAGLVS